MSYLTATLLLFVFAAAGCAADRSAPTASTRPTTAPMPMHVRVMTYNIHHGAGGDGRLDLQRIADIVRTARADLVAIQEVDVGTSRTGKIDEAAELGRLSGMNVRFGKAMGYQGGAYGQVILSRWPIASLTVEPLPGPAEMEPRIAIVATIPGDGARPDITFAGTHLDYHDRSVQVQQAQRLLERIKPDGVTFLCGDFNARPDSDAMKQVLARWQSATPDDAVTHPADAPKHKIDWILLPPSSQFRVIEAQVIDERTASDHRPVVAEIELPAAR